LIGKCLNFRDKLLITFLLLAIGASAVYLGGYHYLQITEAIPKKGGEYIEGIVGQPLYVNPLLSQTSEVDSNISQLVYSGLFKYDRDGNVVQDLAESYSISEDKKEYTINVRKDAKWHDGQSVTAQDVLFTFNLIQDPSYKSLLLRQSFTGVSFRLIDDYTVVFSLKNPYIGFLDNLTVGILPKHIWENIAPERFSLAEYNLQPIGCGPYFFSDFQKDAEGNILTYKLAAFKDYHGSVPFISKITFNFYPENNLLIEAYNKKEVMGMASITPGNLKDLKNVKSTRINELLIPRYFSVFFNQTKSVPLAYDEVRKALNLSIDREEIIETVMYGKGTALASPFLPNMNGYVDSGTLSPNLDEAGKLLEDAGWKMDQNENVRKNDDEILQFELVTANYPELVSTAELLKQQWEKIGARAEIKVLSASDLDQNYIRTREYDSLLFGQAISFNGDLYSFWHSSQKHDPGLNLSLFDNKDADEILESARQEADESKRAEAYRKFQEILAQEVPAVFLYSRHYLYPTSTKVHGIEIKNVNSSHQRFVDVCNWYLKTKRVFK
jgi:peptide/nickel transport system substrate-binding protein